MHKVASVIKKKKMYFRELPAPPEEVLVAFIASEEIQWEKVNGILVS